MKKIGIRALILDYGGVISNPQNPDNVQNILKALRVDDNSFQKVYQDQRGNYDNGQLSGKEYWLNMHHYYGLEPNESKINLLIQEDVKSWTHVNISMIRFIKESRKKLQKLAIISNMTRETLAYMHRHFQWLAYFDEKIYSCELGINKPDIRIYETCLNRLGIPPQECLFVDDSEENVLGAMKSGMQAVHFKSITQFLQEFDTHFCLVHGPDVSQ